MKAFMGSNTLAIVIPSNFFMLCAPQALDYKHLQRGPENCEGCLQLLRKVRAPKDAATCAVSGLEPEESTVQGFERKFREPEEQWNRENVRGIDLEIVNERSQASCRSENS